MSKPLYVLGDPAQDDQTQVVRAPTLRHFVLTRWKAGHHQTQEERLDIFAHLVSCQAGNLLFVVLEGESATITRIIAAGDYRDLDEVPMVATAIVAH